MKPPSMAAESVEYFSIGSTVVCQTCHNRELEGEVLAFDAQTKMLILKCSSSNGKPSVSDVHMINLNYVSNVTVKKEVSSNPPPMKSLDLSKLTALTKSNTEVKVKLANAMAAGVSPEGQKLYLTISKLYDELTWQGDSIVVMNRVIVSPPYRPENCKAIGSDNLATETRIRKTIEKHLKDQEQLVVDASNNSSGHSSSSSSSSSSQMQQ